MEFTCYIYTKKQTKIRIVNDSSMHLSSNRSQARTNENCENNLTYYTIISFALKEVYVSKLSCQPEPMKLEVLESGETTAVITEL